MMGFVHRLDKAVTYISYHLTEALAAPTHGIARGIGIGDVVAITGTVRRRVDEDRVSVSIPSYNFPHSIIDRTTNVKRGQQIELSGSAPSPSSSE
ncbi:hypothetical protein [Mesorhizobium sp. M0520]|uniref:hypothetical protein n=1 Tax=Mesorhizobium sp. M0520 TaxID=2956957 RepID=UPI00333CABB6